MPIRTWGETTGEHRLHEWERDLFTVIKLRKDNECCMCKKVIKKGCYCLGVQYSKICINCADRFVDNFIKSLEGHKKLAEELKENIKENRGRYIKNNVINSV